MVNILRRPNPTIADVQCQRLKFQPGDPVLVRTYHKLDKDQKRKLQRSIIKWAGCEVRVMIINCLEMDLEFQKGSK